MTASLVGFAKPPDFEKCFPPKRPAKSNMVADMTAMFRSIGGEVKSA